MKPLSKIHEVVIHYKRPIVGNIPLVKSSTNALKLLKSCFVEEQLDVKEFFWVMLMTRSNHVLGVVNLGSGSSHGVSINIKEIFQVALLGNATSIILCHNHPSGNLKPSNQDLKITQQVKEFGRMIGVETLDHIIITSEGHYSLADNGEM